MSAAEAWGKPHAAPKAAYSKVASSDTRKTATLAIQKTGQGDPANSAEDGAGVRTEEDMIERIPGKPRLAGRALRFTRGKI